MYYTYVYEHPLTNTFFYVGKGKNNRLYSHWDHPERIKNKLFREEIINLKNNNLKPNIFILENNLKCGEAYKKENELICKYGRLNIDENGILLNRSQGYEHFNISKDKVEEYLKYLDESKKHFNYKDVNERDIIDICFLYEKEEKSLHQIREIYGFGVGKIRNILTSNGVRIKNKSETRLGDKNPAWGRRGLITKGFTGKKHTEESKNKTSITLKTKKNRNV